VNAKGEGKPIATNNNPAGRQLNRRVEFYIVGGPGYEAKAMAYVIEPKTTLYSVAKKFHMTVDELKQLNGLNDEKIMAYRPLRVRRTGDEDIIAPSTINYAQTAIAVDNPGANPSSSGKTKEKKEESVRKTDKVKKEDNRNKSEAKQQNLGEDQLVLNEHSQKTAMVVKHTNEGEEHYVVEEGDVLFGIAEKYGMTVEELRKLNGLRSNKLFVGQKLRVQRSANLRTSDPTALYVVRNGDTMYIIATKFGLTVEELKQMNNLKDNTLYENMVLRVKK
jgi:LysM repeat protein